MKKKRLIIAIVCILLAVLMIGSLFVAAGVAFAHADNFQFGGLVGELLAGKAEGSSNGETTDNATNETAHQSEELITDNTHTEDITDMIDPPQPGGTPTLLFFLGGCDTWIGNAKMQEVYSAAFSSDWNHRAVIDYYEVEYVRIWGWAALFSEVPLQLGYQIDDEQPVYNLNAEFYEPDQSSTTAALGMGAISATGLQVYVPVEYLSGLHTVKILIRLQGGNDESAICTFEIQKAKNPYTPVFLTDAAYLANMLDTQPNVGVDSYTHTPPADGESGWVSMKTATDHGYLTILPANGTVHSTGARYLAIKWCKSGIDSAMIYVGSGAGPGDGNDLYTLESTEYDWQFILIDLEELEAVNDSYDITYLRFDFFTKLHDDFQIAYIATFETIEDAQQYDAKHPYAKG